MPLALLPALLAWHNLLCHTMLALNRSHAGVAVTTIPEMIPLYTGVTVQGNQRR